MLHRLMEVGFGHIRILSVVVTHAPESWVRKSRNGRSTVELRPSLHVLYFHLEGVSETEIGLYKVFHRRIEVMIPTPDPVIAGLAKDSDMGSKPILESTAG